MLETLRWRSQQQSPYAFAIFSVHLVVCQSKLDSLLHLVKLWCPMKLLPVGTWHLNFTETERWKEEKLQVLVAF